MLGGLATSYGACGAMGGRYLFPARSRALRWLYVARVDDLPVGGSTSWRSPTGERIAVARRTEAVTADAFIALSSTCPHLGCQVHWEHQNTRFFCPCHNGVFAPDGEATSGPPAEAGQSLPRYPLKVENGLLFIEAPIEGLASADTPVMRRDDGRGAPPGPGHDPCLFPEPPSKLA
jgi:nitrite reductase/ring-hydroxylating ferredoxin subunit